MVVAIVVIVFVVVGTALTCILIGEIKKQQGYNSSGKDLRRRLARSRKEFIGKSEKWHWERATRQKTLPLKTHLASLAGSPMTAERLIKNIQNNNPTASEQWCVEKAIYDLERDRL